MNYTETNIPFPFNAEEFRREGHKVVDTLADYLSDALSGKEMPVMPWNEPEKLTEIFSLGSEGGQNEPVDSFIRRIITYSNHLHHPNYIGHQVTSPLPVTALVQFCTTLLNNGAAIYEMGPVSMAMEKNVIRYIGSMIGYNTLYDGIFTHGGTAGNLTAMLAARQTKTDYNIWEEGVSSCCRPAFMVSEQSHYSIGRNVKIMGLGDDALIRVPFDSTYRMKSFMLEEQKKMAEDRGLKVISVVANSCSTATGSYDDLNLIADFCEKYNLWMHVDGAHGMGVLFSEKHRSKITGIERADSVVIDFHKMLLVPALNTLVMFRDGERSYETFAQKASYLFNKSQQNVWYNSAVRTIECTKSSLGVIAYTAIKYYGADYYREYIDGRYDLTTEFASYLKADKRFELATIPESNIICFRYSPSGYSIEAANRLNAAIRERIIKDGTYYIVQAELGGKLFLRLTIINPVTSMKELRELILTIDNLSKELSE